MGLFQAGILRAGTGGRAKEAESPTGAATERPVSLRMGTENDDARTVWDAAASGAGFG